MKSITQDMSALDELNATLDKILPEFAGCKADQIAEIARVAREDERKQRLSGYDPISKIPTA